MVFSYKKSKIDKNKTNPLPDKKNKGPENVDWSGFPGRSF